MLVKTQLITSFIIFFMTSITQANDGKWQMMSSHEYVLPALRYEALIKDRPFGDALITSQGVWIAGASSVWFWNLEGSRLVQIPLLSQQEPKGFCCIHVDNDQLYLAAHNTLFRLSLSPRKIIKYRHIHAEPSARSLQLQSSESGILWIHSKGIVRIDKKGEQQLLYKVPSNLQSSYRCWFYEKLRQLWSIHHNILEVYDLRYAKTHHKIIHQAKNPYLGLHGWQDSVLAYTNLSVLKFGSDYKLEQILPVEGTHRLIAADFTNEEHAYLFNDRQLEIYKIKTHQKYATQLQLRGKVKVTRLRIYKNVAAVLTDQGIQIFRLDYLPQLSKKQDSHKTKGL